MMVTGQLARLVERAAFLFGCGHVSCDITDSESRGSLSSSCSKLRKCSRNWLSLLEAGEADKFAAHLYQSRRQYRRISERPNKGNKAIEREISQATRSRRARIQRRLSRLGALVADSGGRETTPLFSREAGFSAWRCKNWIATKDTSAKLRNRRTPTKTRMTLSPGHRFCFSRSMTFEQKARRGKPGRALRVLESSLASCETASSDA